MLKCLNVHKGVSVYLAVIVMFILLGIGLGLSTILVGQMKMLRGMGYSVIAFYAADTGIERLLYEDRQTCRQLSPCASYCSDPAGIPGEPCDGLSVGLIDDFKDQLVGEEASYTAQKVGPGGSCPIGASFCFNSVGVYKGIRRAIEVSFQ